MLLGLLCVIMVRPEANVQLVQEMQFFAPVYRCVGLLIVLLWLWSFLVQLWDNFSVPYVLMFQLSVCTRRLQAMRFVGICGSSVLIA
jgi:hypothetical protein